jgi:hypothetical protein
MLVTCLRGQSSTLGFIEELILIVGMEDAIKINKYERILTSIAFFLSSHAKHPNVEDHVLAK